MEELSNVHIEKEEEVHGWKQELWGFVKVVVISLLIVLPVRAFIVQPFIVRGASMEPNYAQGEYLVVDEISYHFRAPRRGEVIVFRYPKNPSQFFIKRIIGLPGERVEVRDGHVVIINDAYPDGFTLDEPYLDAGTRTNFDTVAVLDGEEYFVMGDNRFQSSDSRLWGALDSRFLVGHAWLRLWPVARAEVLQ